MARIHKRARGHEVELVVLKVENVQQCNHEACDLDGHLEFAPGDNGTQEFLHEHLDGYVLVGVLEGTLLQNFGLDLVKVLVLLEFCAFENRERLGIHAVEDLDVGHLPPRALDKARVHRKIFYSVMQCGRSIAHELPLGRIGRQIRLAHIKQGLLGLVFLFERRLVLDTRSLSLSRFFIPKGRLREELQVFEKRVLIHVTILEDQPFLKNTKDREALILVLDAIL